MLSYVTCFSYDFHSWSDVLLGVKKNPETDNIPQVDVDLPETDEAKPVQNILLWFHDGLSRSYFLYNLPKTWSFLESLLEEKSGNGGFYFRGHNTLGLNSAPNMVPLWTGRQNMNFS